MEKNPYALAKLGLENNATLRPQRDCGFYAKYFFLFLSLIQFLIILGLVLFMVYGNNHASANTEKHLQGMNIWLQECRLQKGALTKDKANLTSLLNASRSESRQITANLNRINSTLRSCSTEKMRCQVQNSENKLLIQKAQVCYEIVSYFNSTYPDKVKALQAQLQAQALTAELEKKQQAQEIERLQAQVKKSEQEKEACQQELLQLRRQAQKVGELESQVTSEVQATCQSMKATVETALPRQPIWSCNTEEVRNLHTTCLNLSTKLDNSMAGLGQRLEDRVHAVAKENAGLQKEKEACARDRQALSHKLMAQEQKATQERDTLQLACSTEKARLYAEQQKLLSEKEGLRQELDRTKQQCWQRMPGASGNMNSNFPANFPMGGPNSFNPPWPRTGGLQSIPINVADQGPLGNLPALRNLAPPGNLGSPRTSSHTGYEKLGDAGRKPMGAGAMAPHQPARQPSG